MMLPGLCCLMCASGNRPQGHKKGFFYEPTVLTVNSSASVRSSSSSAPAVGRFPEIWTTEVFGPYSATGTRTVAIRRSVTGSQGVVLRRSAAESAPSECLRA